MKKLLRLFFLVLASSLLVTGLSAQNILCVDRDFGDGETFTDTWPFINRALQANGHMADYWEVLESEDDGPPLDTMNMYDIVVWFTGEAWTDGFTMTDNDENNLLDFLLSGGKLYLNAQDYLYDRYSSYGEFDPSEFPYFALGVQEVVQDIYHIEVDDGIADSARFYGLPGSLAEGLEFPTRDIFTTPDEEGLYGDSLAQHMGTGMMGILEPYNSVGPAAIQYEDETFGFRSVFSTIEIAAITDTVARDILMGRIIEWLMYGGVGLSEINAEDVNLTISPNPVKDNMRISMNCDMDHIWIYNMNGQVVRHEVVGNNILSLDISELTSGLYIFRASTAEGVVSSKLLKR